MSNILVVDDESQILHLLSEILSEEGHVPILAKNATEGLRKFSEEEPDLVLLDLRLPDGDGLDVLRQIREKNPDAAVIIISAFGTICKAVEAVRLGAYDFMEKPLETNRVLVTVRNALEKKSLVRAVHAMKDEQSEKYRIVGESQAVAKVLDLVHRVASAAANVLVTGESGTGKELVARRIHALSPRALKPFVKVNCAAVPNELIESELFGYERGAFTGATSRRSGHFAVADGGSLLLDEVGDTSLFMQSKLLRVIEEKEIVPLGSSKARKVDVRLIAATNKDLGHETHEGNFREDLLHRLSVLVIPVPSLRERKEDIPSLVDHFLTLSAAENNLSVRRLRPESLRTLMHHHWPGNVRELRNLVERVTILSTSDVVDSDLLTSSLAQTRSPSATAQSESLSEAHDRFEKDYILSVLNEKSWKMEATAKALGIDRSSLFRKMKRLGIQKPPKSAL